MKKLMIILVAIEAVTVTVLMTIMWVILSFIYNGLYDKSISSYTELIYCLVLTFYIASHYIIKIVRLIKE